MEALKIFDRWDTTGIAVKDQGLERYITLKPILVPKTGARYAGKTFYKSRIHIVERLMNKVMVVGHKSKKHKFTSGLNTGKGHTAYNITLETLEIVEKKTKKNPVEVLVRAIENGAPREETITIEYGGARYPKAVECAPQRRVDLCLRLMTQGAFQKSAKSKRQIAACLAEEIVTAFQLSPNSTVIAKKQELERQADASR